MIPALPAWYILGKAETLLPGPSACKLMGVPIVVYRPVGPENGMNGVAVLLDRCAHRNVPLSAGCVRGDRLECAYHGWQYDTRGICRVVPALQGTAEGKARRVPAFAARVHQGFVWAYGQPDSSPPCEPHAFADVDAPGVSSVFYTYRFAASLQATAENILDVVHTAFLHRGLFRSGPSGRRIEAVVRRGDSMVEAEYVGEPVPRGVLGRMLAPRGGTVEHFDRFMLPSLAQVEYRLGPHSLCVTNALTPVEEDATDVHTVVTLRLPRAMRVLARSLTPLAVQVARQDARMLALQTANTKRFGGPQWVHSEVDVLAPHIARLLRQQERGEAGPWHPADRPVQDAGRCVLEL